MQIVLIKYDPPNLIMKVSFIMKVIMTFIVFQCAFLASSSCASKRAEPNRKTYSSRALKCRKAFATSSGSPLTLVSTILSSLAVQLYLIQGKKKLSTSIVSLQRSIMPTTQCDMRDRVSSSRPGAMGFSFVRALTCNSSDCTHHRSRCGQVRGAALLCRRFEGSTEGLSVAAHPDG